MAANIRFATEADIPVILEFIHALAAYENMEDQVIVTPELLKEWVFQKKKAEVFLVSEDEKPVGFALFFHNFSTWLGRAGIYLEDLFVLPEYRGKGYGKLMLSAALKECAKLGIDKALVTIHEGNTASVKMALANGGIMEKRENGNLFIWMDCHSNRGNIFYDTSDLSDGEIMLRVSRMTDSIPEKKFVPAYKFDICLMNGMAIGVCDLRIGHTEGLYIGGNIGYGIDENYRGRHYAAKACRLLFRLAQKHNLGHVFITCVPDNAASYKTMEYAGCRYVGMAMIHEDDEMYKEGKRLVKIYRKDLD